MKKLLLTSIAVLGMTNLFGTDTFSFESQQLRGTGHQQETITYNGVEYNNQPHLPMEQPSTTFSNKNNTIQNLGTTSNGNIYTVVFSVNNQYGVNLKISKKTFDKLNKYLFPPTFPTPKQLRPQK